MIELIKSLCEIPGVSGREDAVRDFIISKLPAGTDYTVDNLGNLIVHKKGAKTPSKKLMMCAHMDEVGLIITYITDDGLLKFDEIGGIDPAVLIGRTVTLESGVKGVISLKHIHLTEKDEAEKIPKHTEMHIDIGAKSKEEAEKYASLGSYAVFDSDCVEFGTGEKYIKMKALDDRAGCAFMLGLINDSLPYDVDFAFDVQEEIGTVGAFAATYGIMPDVCVVLETTTAGDIDGVEGEKRACLLGEGPVVSYMDRGTVYDHNLYKATMALAKTKGIKAQTKTLVAGGNDSRAVKTVGEGARVIAISIPTRYLHSPSCVMNKDDISATYELIKAFVEDFE